MAQPVEPMDIDSEFDNKENSYLHSNVLPCTEKGYEELDVSELNMKLRYSVTPASSPMSKSYTANCHDNRSFDSGDDSLNITVNENTNLTRSLNSNLKNDSAIKSLKALPLQSISTEQFVDNRSTVLRPLDTTVSPDNANVTVTVCGVNDIDENLSLPSSSSSMVQTPEATTPTKDIPKSDGSPIMRGLKSVLNMFRSSQSPIPPAENESSVKPDILSPVEDNAKTDNSKVVMASTPISAHRNKDISPSKRNSPYKESIVFNDDLEKELQWKDETTILFSQERIPIHKLFFQQSQTADAKNIDKIAGEMPNAELNSTVEYMDISYNDSIRDKTITEHSDTNKIEGITAGESDSEFVDCETTFTKSEPQLNDNKDVTATEIQDVIKNQSSLRLNPVILNTTQDILDATLSITPEDLKTEVLDNTKESPVQLSATETNMELSGNTKNADVPITNENMQLELTYKQQIDETFELSENRGKENPNETKTIEHNISQGNIEQVQPLSDFPKVLDVTKTIDNINNETVILEDQPSIQTHQNLDITHTVDNISQEQGIISSVEPLDATYITQTTNQETKPLDSQTSTSTIANAVTNDKISTGQADDDTDIIPIEKEVNDDTLQVQSTIPVENLNITTESIPLDNKTNGNGSLPVLENNNQITEREFAIEQVNITDNIDTSNVNISTVEPSKVVDVKEIVTEHVEIIAPEVISLQTPAEVPLPDEDDIDKEFNLDSLAESLSVQCSDLPLDLVESITLKSGTESVNSIENINNIAIPTVIDTNSVINEDNDGKEQSIQPPAVLLPEVSDDTDQTIDTATNIVKNVCNEVLPEIVSTPDNLLKEDIMSTNQTENSEPLIDSHPVIESSINVISSNYIQEGKSELDVHLPMDINESVPEYKSLPDIINQINTLLDTEATKNVEHDQLQIESGTIGDNVENIQLGIEPAAEFVPTVVINVPPESGDAISMDKMEPFAETPTSNKTENITKDIPIIAKSDETMIVHDDVTNMSIDGNVEIAGDANYEKQNTVTSVLTATNNVEIVTETALINKCNIIEMNNTECQNTVIEEVIVTSENSSPFVAIVAEPDIKREDVENIEDPFANKTRIVCTPPSSPPIASKGYNFNFDEIDDPFATKTMIRLSPTLESKNKASECNENDRSFKKPVPPKKDTNNRRKSQPDRKRPVAPKNKLNSTFHGHLDKTHVDKPVEKTKVSSKVVNATEGKPEITDIPFDKEDKEVQDIIRTANDNIEQKLQEALKLEKEYFEKKAMEAIPLVEKPSVESVTEVKDSSSSEQSTYFSAGTSSSESIKSKNVFNLPEIDDMNFNPFATKSKMRQSPPIVQETDNPFATRCKMMTSPEIPVNNLNVTRNLNEIKIMSDDKMETELMEKDSLNNISNTTSSSKGTEDRDTTIREVNTEDEDTVEGPFLESDDLNDEFKVTDFDTENDMMRFSDVPPPIKEDTPENDELFIDAEAFEFLLNQNKSNTVADSGKESLFLKFDPLFAKRTSSDGVLAALTRIQKRQSTPTKLTKPPQQEAFSPTPGPSNINVTHSLDMNTSEELNDDLNVTVSKPMMVVPPAVNPVTPRNKSITPTRSNRRSVTFTSPAMAVIDRLLSLSANNSPMHDNTYTHMSREQNEADLALSQLRELLAEKEVHVYNLRTESKELKDRLCTMESQVRNLETENQTRLKKINDLNDRLVEKTKINKSMAVVVEEYERTIASLIAETEQDKKRHAEERMKLISERDEQTTHLASMEVSFSDLHSKYEKSKQVILTCKANEDAYKKSIKDFEENLVKMKNNYELLKQHATSKLNYANQELEKMNKAHEAEVLKLNAMIKRKDLHITSLEESLAQKTKANEELTAICDELINKVG